MKNITNKKEQYNVKITVFRSSRYISAQIIDKKTGNVLVDAMSKKFIKDGGNTKGAYETGKLLAEKAKQLNFQSIEFDRNNYKYHGRVKSLAEGARDAGLKF